MVGLWHRRPDAGLQVKPCRLAVLPYVRIGDRLQVPQSEHVDIGLKQTAIWDWPRNLFESQRLLGEIELQESILIWWCAVKRPPDDIEASSCPGSLQTCEQPELIVGSVDRRKPQRSVDRGYRRKGKVGFEFHLPFSVLEIICLATDLPSARATPQQTESAEKCKPSLEGLAIGGEISLRPTF